MGLLKAFAPEVQSAKLGVGRWQLGDGAISAAENFCFDF
jgi:hypothetical protein